MRLAILVVVHAGIAMVSVAAAQILVGMNPWEVDPIQVGLWIGGGFAIGYAQREVEVSGIK